MVLTYWEPNGSSSDLYGKPMFKGPEYIDCRWEYKTELFRDKEGQEVNCRSKIFMLNKDIDLNGYVMLGRSTGQSPTEIPEAYEVRAVSRIPDLRGLKELTVVWV